ncbi:hypothetical protein Dsin_030037 [Dipteronia sinensis]|uniref:Pentatricopeptide repeat-containing protein n=1 Tax=Dipteronia sinensis TaxID=43782 RepID=A0AAD9ZHX0_9ROSI|nr:hypothetical protein Dsin_030037 [Dipteronia sinensis]
MESHLCPNFSPLHTQILNQKTRLWPRPIELGFVNSFMGNANQVKSTSIKLFYFFDYMIHMQPTPLMSCFNILFTALVKNKHYGDVISLQTRMNSLGLVPDFITLNILINCCCKMGRVGDGFVVFGALLRRGFHPDDATFTCLIKGLCSKGGIMEATGLKKMIAFGCRPDVVTFSTLIHGLCRSDNTVVALQLHEQVVNGNSKYSVTCKPDVVWYGSIIDCLCKDRFIDKAKELFLEMKGRGIHANSVIYNSLIHGLCYVDD